MTKICIFGRCFKPIRLQKKLSAIQSASEPPPIELVDPGQTIQTIQLPRGLDPPVSKDFIPRLLIEPCVFAAVFWCVSFL